MNNIVFVGLGSNKNDRLGYLEKALITIAENQNISIEKVSSVYETKPYGVKNQNNFYNAAVKLKTSLPLKDFFVFCKEVELKTGRTKSIRWGEREIDIDILFFNQDVYSDDNLSIPHKEILLRDFVIVPLVEIEHELFHPVAKKKLCELDLSGIEKNIVGKFSFEY